MTKIKIQNGVEKIKLSLEHFLAVRRGLLSSGACSSEQKTPYDAIVSRRFFKGIAGDFAICYQGDSSHREKLRATLLERISYYMKSGNKGSSANLAKKNSFACEILGGNSSRLKPLIFNYLVELEELLLDPIKSFSEAETIQKLLLQIVDTAQSYQ